MVLECSRYGLISRYVNRLGVNARPAVAARFHETERCRHHRIRVFGRTELAAMPWLEKMPAQRGFADEGRE